MRVAVRGSGIASGCCAHLLGRRGIEAVVTPSARPPVPALLLSDPALALLRDVFGQPSLFADKPRIERRVVSWGGSDAIAVPHGAIVVSEEELNAALCPLSATSDDAPAHFTIHTAPPLPAGTLRSFGARRAMAAAVRLNHDEDRTACWVEAVETGWLFLIPSPDHPGTASLLGVGAPMDVLTGESRHIAPRVTLTGTLSSAFETCPRMLTILQGPDWLACGTAAIAFDPICGDGTAQAIREAIIASAVIAAIREGGDAASLRGHYESMLIASMRRHLMLSAQFYQSGGRSPWWQEQLAALSDGHGWCTARLAAMPEPRYQLRDFDLVPREVAA